MRYGHVLRALETATLLAVCAVLFGCVGSREPRYFMLADETKPDVGKPDALPLEQTQRIILLRTVRIPAYLERPQIVTRPLEHEIMASEFNRWGMPLENAATVLLANVLERELPGYFIETASAPSRPASVMHVQVEIVRLDGVLGGDVNLTARWSIWISGDQTVAVRRVSTYQQVAEGAGYDCYAQAVGTMVARLGREIAAQLRAIRHPDLTESRDQASLLAL